MPWPLSSHLVHFVHCTRIRARFHMVGVVSSLGEAQSSLLCENQISGTALSLYARFTFWLAKYQSTLVEQSFISLHQLMWLQKTKSKTNTKTKTKTSWSRQNKRRMVLVTTPLLTSSSLRGEQLEAAIHGLGRCWAISTFGKSGKYQWEVQVPREKIYICQPIWVAYFSTGDSASSHRREANCKISDREVSARRWITWRDAFSLNSTQQKRVLGVRKRDSYH